MVQSVQPLVNVLSMCGIHCPIALISVHYQSLGALSCVLIFLNSSDVSMGSFCFYCCIIIGNDKATASARMSLVCLAHRLYHCTVSSVFVLTLFEQIK